MEHLIKELEFAFVPRKRFFVNNTSLKTKIQRKPTRSRTNNMLIALHPFFFASFRRFEIVLVCFRLTNTRHAVRLKTMMTFLFAIS